MIDFSNEISNLSFIVLELILQIKRIIAVKF